jgi:hypothetical protein
MVRQDIQLIRVQDNQFVAVLLVTVSTLVVALWNSA